MIEYLNELLVEIIYLLPAILISLTVHEYSHGYVAYLLGDPTAREQGRLSLNPIKHIDPMGFIALLIIRFGWAKPVPVNPGYFKKPRKGMMITALAGPVSNLALAFISSFFTTLVFYLGFYFNNTFLGENLFSFFKILSAINLGLAIFNLLPISPLDGGHILGYFLPQKANAVLIRNENAIRLGFFLLLIIPGLPIVGEHIPDIIGISIGFVQNNIFMMLIRMWQYPILFFMG